MSLSLYGNDGSDKGIGKLLYCGRASVKAFPLPVTLQVDREVFFLQFGSEVETKSGSRSGHHGLVEEKWKGDVGFGVRLVTLTDGNKPTMRLANVSAVTELPAASVGNQSGKPSKRSSPITAVVQVRPELIQSSGGYDQVQPLFGGNVNGQSKGKADALIRELNLNTSRFHMWPETYGAPKEMRAPTSPSFAGQFGNGGGYQMPLPADQIDAAWDKWFQLDFNTFLVPCISKGAAEPNCGSMESQLALQKVWGSTDNIVFYGTHKMDSGAVRNSAGACRYFDQYLSAVEKYAPWINATFTQLTNEPNYGWWTSSFKSQKEAIDGWIKLYNIMDAYLRKTHPKTRLLGPCLASSEFFSWGGWQDWTVPVLKEAALDMEYFNYHNYDTAAVSHLAWVQLLQAHAGALGRKTPRAVVTEMNDNATCDKAARKFEWWSEQLFTALEHPDKFHLFSYFLLVYPSMQGDQWGNLVSLKGDVSAPTETYWLFWVLRQTRGSIRYVEETGVPDLKVFACAPQDDKLVLSLLNNTGRPVKLTLRSGLPKDAKIQSLLRWSAHRQADVIWHSEENLPPAADVQAELYPGAVQSFVWQLDGPVLKDARKLERREFFSKTLAAKFSTSIEAPLDVPRLPNDDEDAFLRFAVCTDNALAARGLTVDLNGYSQSVAWTDAPREQDRAQRSIWWMELPVPAAKLAKSNKLSFLNADTDYRLMFASLVYRQQSSKEEARKAEVLALARRSEGLAVSFAPLGAIMAGDKKTLSMTIENRGDAAASCAVSFTAPSGTSVEGLPAESKLEIPAKAKRELHGAVLAGESSKIRFLRLLASIEKGNGECKDYPAALTLYPKRNAAHLQTAPVIDGKLDEWPDADTICVGTEGKTARLRLGWDEASLYLAAEVKTGKRPEPPKNPGHFWESDVLELFIDVGNKKSPLYTDTDAQFYFCPYPGEGGAPASGRCLRIRKGDVAAHNGIQTDGPWRVASQMADDGYTLECAIPWSELAKDFKPQAGSQLGMDVAIHGFESLFGADEKPFDNPSLWGILNLK